jgi:hypothetical protein
MSADSRALLPMLWLLACEDKDPKSGLIQLEIEEISFRIRQQEKVINKCLIELQGADFIECIESVTKPLRECNETVPPETETETETEKSRGFKKPSPKDVNDYANEKNIDLNRFHDHYTSNGWKVGKVPMKDWKATARNWAKRSNDFQPANRNNTNSEFEGF